MRLIDADALANRIIDAPRKQHDLTGEVITNSMLWYLHEAPTIEPPRWIPCSERVPDDGTLALITDSDGDVFVAGYDIWLNQGRWTTDDVVAWMPLPEPYEEGNNE